MMKLAEFWPQCLSLLAAELTEQQFDFSIAPLTVGEEDGAWVVYAKTQFAANLLRSQYGAKLAQARELLAPDAPPVVRGRGAGPILLCVCWYCRLVARGNSVYGWLGA